MIINNKEQLVAEFKKLLAEQTNTVKLIVNKNIFFKKNVANLYTQLKALPADQKRNAGLEINAFNQELTALFETRKVQLDSANELTNNKVNYDLNIDTYNLAKGSKTILSIVYEQIINYFKALNFQIVDGDEVTTIENNMDRLNIDKTHPARDPKDTFYIDTQRMLRTHCTSTTAEAIHNQDREIKVLSYGNVYRNDDDDLTHSHQFSQIDIVWVKNNLSINHLKSVIDGLIKHIFGNEVKTRYRLSYFPFTEPSFEVDVSCFNCGGKGCPMCKQSGWIEILGAGMLHKNVLESAHIKKINSGLAAGIGIERIAMLKYGIKDVRDIYNNDFRLLNQLKGVK
ncbi:MAG: phenylalanine--tRNA ligase subunit alpha [Mycoplasma sp.]|nr:phenylalanine--tRNA ligase subunit alpha [Candidatus Hennigella equi]